VAAARERSESLLGFCLMAAIVQRDACASGGKLFGGDATDAARRARDEYGFVGEIHECVMSFRAHSGENELVLQGFGALPTMRLHFGVKGKPMIAS
jgi:hypothetical protein